MIKLTRLDGEPFILNADLIRYVESRPDTYVTLTVGERLVVRESMDEVMRRAVEYQRSKYLLPPPVKKVSGTDIRPSIHDGAANRISVPNTFFSPKVDGK